MHNLNNSIAEAPFEQFAGGIKLENGSADQLENGLFSGAEVSILVAPEASENGDNLEHASVAPEVTMPAVDGTSANLPCQSSAPCPPEERGPVLPCSDPQSEAAPPPPQPPRPAGSSPRNEDERMELLNRTAQAHGPRVETLLANEIGELVHGDRVPGGRIPYSHIDANGARVPTLEPGGQRFARARLPDEGYGGMKCYQAKGTSVHVYAPANLDRLLREESLLPASSGPRRLYLQEGEWKALAMMEAGLPSLGIGGINSFLDATGGVYEEILNAIRLGNIQDLVFVGDTDTALNPRFSQAANGLARTKGSVLSR